MERKGITVAGSMIADHYYLVDTYPEQGRLTHIKATTKDVGGSGNLIVDLAKLDSSLSVKVSAVIGQGSNGRMIRSVLSQYPNIDQSSIIEEGETSMTMVMDAQDTHQRTFFYMPAASDLYDESYIDWKKADADIFHLEYLLLMKKVDEMDPVYGTHAARILHTAREKGMRTSIDMVSESGDRARQIVQAALPYTDYCTINEWEAEALTGCQILQDGIIKEKQICEALRSLKRMGVSIWAIIHSPHCSYGIDCRNDQIIMINSLVLPEGYIKGATGAGDAYCAGILYGAYLGNSLEQSMRLGTSCAACSLSEISGTAGLRSYEKVLEFYHGTVSSNI